MAKILSLILSIFLLTTHFSTAFAATPEKRCQATKNTIAAKYAECRYRAEFSSPKKYDRIIARCDRRYNNRWQRVIAATARAGATCFDSSLTSEAFREATSDHTEAVASLLGKAQQLSGAVKRCRRQKSVAAGTYVACRLRAESIFAKTGKDSRRDRQLSRCERKFERRWRRILNRTSRAKATCYDDGLSVSDFKSIIDLFVETISKVLAGEGSLAPAVITLSGTPLALTAESSTGSMTITNTSKIATVTGVSSNFTGTALEGVITETGNTCGSVSPGSTCTLTFTPGNAVVPATDFVIGGSNTNAVTGVISIVAGTLTVSVTGSPLTLTVNGPTGELTITNNSTIAAATDILSSFTDTALDGNLVESGNTCSTVEAGSTCALTFTPGDEVVAATDITIEGSNILPTTASIEIQSGSTLDSISASSGSASGSTGVTLTGTGLDGATGITFGGQAATAVNVVSSTLVTAVTPANVAGTVDVVIETPAGGATLKDGYTYLATAVGQPSAGGTISCLDGGLQNLISASSDNSATIAWGGFGVTTNAQSDTDGSANTATITAALGAGSYAAQLCEDFEIDSLNNTPCQAGNTCYQDWFLPAKDQLNCLYTNRVAIGGFANATYYSSTEFDSSNAEVQVFTNGTPLVANKINNLRVRCVRAFSP